MGLEKLKTSAKRRRIQLKIILSITAVCLLIDLICWLSDGGGLIKKAAKFHMTKIFPVITAPFAKLTSAIPFSLGEVLIIIALVGVPLSLILLIILMIAKRKNKDARRTIKRVYGYTFAWIFVYILLTETLNCFILYQTPSFAKMYDYPNEKYTPSQLEQLADFLIGKTNEYSEKVKRDKDGKFVLTADLDETAEQAMLALSDEYPQLEGFYAKPKAVKNSFFMSQQNLMGIYFPFTMEANYNDEMYPLNLPDTVCHELAHTKGFIREDEANFVGFLACDASENYDYKYSGYLRALKYVIGECEENCPEETTARLYGELSDGVITDWNANYDYWKSVEESDEGILDSETVAEVSDKAMEASLKLNGVEDGKKSYGRMVDLLLDWYFMNLEEVDE
ncbi:MAG: DUF3810 domain-containing protein [Oscillospiraceae bacterium]